MNNSRSPLRLSVRTESGKTLGHVVDIGIDPTSHQVTVYFVKPSRLLPDVVSAPLMIRYTQVIKITEKEMVVEDAAISQPQIAAASSS